MSRKSLRESRISLDICRGHMISIGVRQKTCRCEEST
jgi:hypothetical protein